MTDTAKPRRLEFFWSREWWGAETAALIQAWGDTLAALADEITLLETPRQRVLERHIQELEKLKLATTPEAVLRPPRPTQAESKNLWWHFADAVQSCAGMRACFYEDLALFLVGHGFDELAMRLIAIEEFFEPSDAGIARHHIEGLTGRRKESVRALVRVMWEPGRIWRARVRALACVAELDGEAFQEEAKWLLSVAASEDGEDLAAREIRRLMDRYESAGSRRAS
jgi:hypothetical protein